MSPALLLCGAGPAVAMAVGAVAAGINSMKKKNEQDSLSNTITAPFALFAGATYYPPPGWMGHRGQFSSLDEAAEKGKKLAEELYGWWQVVDLRSLKIVAGQGSGHTGLLGLCPASYVDSHAVIVNGDIAP